jgi:hypothetical protein
MPVYSEEYAMHLLRNKGMIEYKSYLSLFDPPEEETNLPKLQIFCCEETNHEGHPNCCPVMIDAIKACSYDKKSKEGKAAEDVSEFDGDDPYDDLRYACDKAERYFETAGKKFTKIQRQEAITQALAHNQDFTAFYRNMRTLEAKPPMKVIKNRFSRGRHFGRH